MIERKTTAHEPESSPSPEYALIVAGGRGTRFGSRTPKQFHELSGRPILLHTLDAFLRYSADIHLVLVLPKEDIAAWKEICARHHYTTPVEVVAGGMTRFQSVKNGLAHIPENALVAIHDGVRPFVSARIIGTSFALAKVHGSAVASVPLKESLRLITESESAPAESTAVDRSLYRIIQTPQTFQSGVIHQAYSVAEDETLTDDASVAERSGAKICLFEGDPVNIKITHPEDLIIAEALLSRRTRL